MNELALFAGAGGGILGGHLLGWRTVCAVERDAYAAQVLAQRQNDRAIRPFPIWSDVSSFDGRPWRGRVDVVSGGFPCQDISVAGKCAGITGERSGMWSHMARIIGEVRPSFAFVENSPALLTRGLGVVLSDLPRSGMTAGGQCWELGTLALLTCERGFGSWPTPTRSDAKRCKDLKIHSLGKRAKEDGAHWNFAEHVAAELDGYPSPEFVELLMGWPMGWTDLLPLAMAKSHSAPLKHGESSLETCNE